MSNNHFAADCCATGCRVCGAGQYEPCTDTIDDGDDLEELAHLDVRDISGVVDGFGHVWSDAELEAPGW